MSSWTMNKSSVSHGRDKSINRKDSEQITEKILKNQQKDSEKDISLSSLMI